MNKKDYMSGMNVLQGYEPGFNGIGHYFDDDELKDLYMSLIDLNGEYWINKCKVMERPCYPNVFEFSYVNYVIGEVKKGDKQ